MKQIISIIVCKKLTEEIAAPESGLDIMYTDEERSTAEIISGAVKQCKSKYITLVDGDFALTDASALLQAAESASADILTFDGGYLFKASVLKGLDLEKCKDKFLAEVFATLSSKSVAALDIKPVKLVGTHAAYSDEIRENLLKCLKEFKSSKAKLPKDVYSVAFEMILGGLVTFYIAAILAVRSKAMAVESLVQFDLKLKENIVLYLALEKRFTAADLKKLRENSFKISFITANKFKKLLK